MHSRPELARDGGAPRHITSQLVAHSISEDQLLARRIPLSGTFNVRDIGGYPTIDGRRIASGRLLRGDALHRVDDEGRRLLEGYGLRTSLDLRDEDERRDAPDRLPDGVRIVSIPFFSYAPAEAAPGGLKEIDRARFVTLAHTYQTMVHERAPVIVAAMRSLLEPGALPAIIHCSAGKDRTGILVALLLAVAGAPEEVIAADYAATSLFLDDTFLEVVLSRTLPADFDGARLRALFACEPSLILSVLEEIRRRHGGVDAYLVHHGLAEVELEELRLALLEPLPLEQGEQGEAPLPAARTA